MNKTISKNRLWKEIVLISIFLGIAWILSGCFNFSSISKEERKRAKNAEKEAIPLLLNHFKSKYGIDVEIDCVIADFSGGSFDDNRSYTGIVKSSVIYNDMIYSAEVEDQTVFDNYQAKEIEQACLTYVFEKLNLSQPAFYTISPAPEINDYFDGTNTEKIFNLISPSFIFVYESDVVFDSALPEKINALFENTAKNKQSMEFIILKKGSADEISQIRWYGETAVQYAPYVEYSANYRKNENMKPEIKQYILEPLCNDLPILKEFLILKDKKRSDDLLIRQEEPPKGWDIEPNFEQILPSYHFQWKKFERTHYVFIPSSVWRKLCERYDEIHLIKYRENENGEVESMKLAMNPNNTGYSDVALYGDFFQFRIGYGGGYITFIGIKK